MSDIMGALLIVVVAICCIPAAITFMIWVACYGFIIVPCVLVALYIAHKIRNMIKEEEPIPAHAKPIQVGKPRPTRMVKWQGKEIPLGIFISSMLLAVILTPIVIFTLIFILPPMWSALIIGFCMAKKAGEYINKERRA